MSVLLRDEPFLNLYRLGRTLLNYKYGFPKLWYLGFILHSLSRTKKEIFVCMSTVAHSTSCFSVTTAVAVLATAAHPYQISLFVLLSFFQNHPKVTIVFEIHNLIKNHVSVHRHTDSENVQTCKRHHKLVCSPCTLEKHNIHAMSLPCSASACTTVGEPGPMKK